LFRSGRASRLRWHCKLGHLRHTACHVTVKSGQNSGLIRPAHGCAPASSHNSPVFSFSFVWRLRMKRITLALYLLLAMFLGAAAAQDEGIDIGYVLWDSEIASTHVLAAVIMDELGYDVNLTSVDAGPLWAGLARGDFDATVAAWLPYTHEAY